MALLMCEMSKYPLSLAVIFPEVSQRGTRHTLKRTQDTLLYIYGVKHGYCLCSLGITVIQKDRNCPIQLITMARVLIFKM